MSTPRLRAQIKGVSETVTGLIFGVYELVIFITAPIFGLLVHKIGLKFMFIAGVLVSGTCCILFGFLVYSPPGAVFIIMCFLTRIIQALGSSALITACFALAASEFPENIGFVAGLLETCVGLGLMMGPPIGGALYELAGFGLPFYVMGGILILSGFLSVKILADQSGSQQERGISTTQLYHNSGMLIVTLNVTGSAIGLAFLQPSLAIRLEPFGLNAFEVGLIFLVQPCFYAVTVPVWGWVADKYDHMYVSLVFANIMCAIGFLLLGPVPFLHLPFALWLNIFSLSLLGVCMGCTLIMSYKGYVDLSLKLGYPQDLATFGCISGLFNGGFSMGAFFGPTIGGALDEQLGFAWACSVCAIIYIVVGLISLIYFFVIPKCCDINPSQPVAQKDLELIEEKNR